MAPQPNFYIVRPGTIPRWTSTGELVHEPNIVPLIPADLLPDCIDLEGVSRQLSFAETAGMTNLGNVASPENQYRVRFSLPQGEDNNEVVEAADGVISPAVTPGSTSRCSEAEHDNMKGDEHSEHSRENVVDNHQDARRGSEAGSRNGLASSRHNNANKSSTPTCTEEAAPSPSPTRNPSRPDEVTTPPTPKTKRVFCHHFANHGWCRFGTGCHFKHGVPTTAQGLKSVGLQGWPQWLLDYMHTERLPAIPTRGKKNNMEDGENAYAGKGRQNDGAAAKKKTWTKGVKKEAKMGDLIELL